MNQREARAEGRRNGYSIAEANAQETQSVWDETPEDEREHDSLFDAIVAVALEAESEHFRQFSPFEHFAKELNDCGDRSDGLWEAYEDGVHKGANQFAREYTRKREPMALDRIVRGWSLDTLDTELRRVPEAQRERALALWRKTFPDAAAMFDARK